MDVYLALVFGNLLINPKLSAICIQDQGILLFVNKPYPKASFIERLDIPTRIELKEVITGELGKLDT